MAKFLDIGKEGRRIHPARTPHTYFLSVVWDGVGHGLPEKFIEG
jgi:hypothetical protein